MALNGLYRGGGGGGGADAQTIIIIVFVVIVVFIIACVIWYACCYEGSPEDLPADSNSEDDAGSNLLHFQLLEINSYFSVMYFKMHSHIFGITFHRLHQKYLGKVLSLILLLMPSIQYVHCSSMII